MLTWNDVSNEDNQPTIFPREAPKAAPPAAPTGPPAKPINPPIPAPNIDPIFPPILAVFNDTKVEIIVPICSFINLAALAKKLMTKVKALPTVSAQACSFILPSADSKYFTKSSS